MSDARRLAIINLIKIRRELQDTILQLCNTNELRDFANRHEQGLGVRVREVRNYDVPANDAEELIRLHGVPPRD